MTEKDFLLAELLESLGQLKRDIANLERRLEKPNAFSSSLGVSQSALKVDMLLAQLKLTEKVKEWK